MKQLDYQFYFFEIKSVSLVYSANTMADFIVSLFLVQMRSSLDRLA
jgi:hypothetical protein